MGSLLQYRHVGVLEIEGSHLPEMCKVKQHSWNASTFHQPGQIFVVSLCMLCHMVGACIPVSAISYPVVIKQLRKRPLPLAAFPRPDDGCTLGYHSAPPSVLLSLTMPVNDVQRSYSLPTATQKGDQQAICCQVQLNL